MSGESFFSMLCIVVAVFVVAEGIAAWRSRHIKSQPTVGDRYIPKRERGNPFLAPTAVMVVIEVKDGWVRVVYEGSASGYTRSEKISYVKNNWSRYP